MKLIAKKEESAPISLAFITWQYHYSTFTGGRVFNVSFYFVAFALRFYYVNLRQKNQVRNITIRSRQAGNQKTRRAGEGVATVDNSLYPKR